MADNLRQHAVPEFYLRGFTSADGRLYALDLKANRTFEPTPKNTAVERDCYTIRTDDQRDASCDSVNQALESWCAPRLVSLSAAIAPSNEQWQAASILTANLITRSRRWRDDSKANHYRIAELVEQMAPAIRAKPLPTLVAELFGMTQDSMSGARDAIRRAAEIQYPLNVVGMITPIAAALGTKPCQLLVAPEGSRFITSDDPVVATKAGAVVTPQATESFLLDADLELYLPLQPGICCHWGTGPELRVLQTSPENVVIINQYTRQSAYRQIFSSNDDLLSWSV